MEHTAYKPEPVNIDDIELAPALGKLLEILAEGVHDQWAAGRLKDGWRYGPERDDQKKLHPCLVPYADLPESEKEYDRHTALATLKMIQDAGYKIIKKQI